MRHQPSLSKNRSVGARGARDGAWLNMRMELHPRSVPRLLLPLLARYMHRQQEGNLAAIKAVLEG
jgi:hypothetical protein